MVFFKNIEVRVIEDKYGGIQRGLFALEPIKKGEKIWYCECGAKDESYTRAQLVEKIKKKPDLDYFLRSFSYMIDDDLYGLPVTYAEEKNNDECAYFNHSCTPNVGYTDECGSIGDKLVACCDINTGDELLCHYGFLETEASLIYGLECKCNASNCKGRLTFDYYRDPVFVEQYYPFMTLYLKKKVDDMKHRWYSSQCYVKRFKLAPKQLTAPSSHAATASATRSGTKHHNQNHNNNNISSSTSGSSSSSNGGSASRNRTESNTLNDMKISNSKASLNLIARVHGTSESSTPMSTTPISTINMSSSSSSSSSSASSSSSDDSEVENDSGFDAGGCFDADECEFGLCSLFEIKKDELVAEFKSLDDLAKRNHFLRHSEEANCYVLDTKVFAKYDIPSETELTIYYHGILL